MAREIKDGVVSVFFRRLPKDMVTKIRKAAPPKYARMNDKDFIKAMEDKPTCLPLGIREALLAGDIDDALRLIEGKVFHIFDGSERKKVGLTGNSQELL